MPPRRARPRTSPPSNLKMKFSPRARRRMGAPRRSLQGGTRRPDWASDVPWRFNPFAATRVRQLPAAMSPERPWLPARIRAAQSDQDQLDSHRQDHRPATKPPQEPPKVTTLTRSTTSTTSGTVGGHPASRGTAARRRSGEGEEGAAHGHDRHPCAGNGARDGAPVPPTRPPSSPKPPCFAHEADGPDQ